MTLTELDREVVRRSFDRAASGYNRHAVLQHEVESRLLERIDYFDLNPDRVLDLGCGPGNACAALRREYPGSQVIGLDWSPGMLAESRAREPLAGNLAVCADMLKLPFAARSIDLVFSSLSIQWTSALDQLFDEARRVLRPGGLLLFSTFGPDTLHELRTAWSEVDDRPHVNRFMDMHNVGDLLVRAGFRDPVMDREDITLTYPDVLSLMRELKAIGAHNAATDRPASLTGKGKFQKVLEAYEAFRREDIYPATYEVVFGTATAPEEGQPVRTPEGDVATFSLDALRGGTR